MARTKLTSAETTADTPIEVTPEVTPEVTSEVTSEVTPEVATMVTINLDPVPEEEPPLSAQTLAEMEAGRASIARYQTK